jgi:hypothetical protein
MSKPDHAAPRPGGRRSQQAARRDRPPASGSRGAGCDGGPGAVPGERVAAMESSPSAGIPPIAHARYTARMCDGSDGDEADLGGIGESFLEMLACQVGITPNRATRDRKGWDFHLSLPPARARLRAGSLDARMVESSCFVQVKATRAAEPKARIKLSNWERMAKTTAPFFVFVVGVRRDSAEVERAWLVHVDEMMVRDVLAALRELPEGAGARLSERQRTVPMARAVPLLNCTAGELLAELEAAIGPSMAAYEKRKRGWIEDVGYGEWPLSFAIAVPGEGPERWSRLADFAVGETDALEAIVEAVEERRFGITVPLDPGSFSNFRMHLPGAPVGREVTVEVADADGLEIGVLRGFALDSAWLFSSIPVEYRKLVVRCGCVVFAMTVDADGVPHLRWKAALPSARTQVSLAEAREVAHVVSVLGDEGRAGSLLFRTGDGAGAPVGFVGAALDLLAGSSRRPREGSPAPARGGRRGAGRGFETPLAPAPATRAQRSPEARATPRSSQLAWPPRGAPPPAIAPGAVVSPRQTHWTSHTATLVNWRWGVADRIPARTH